MPTTIVIILLLGGIQLITVGIIGEYVGRIYDEVKHRPLYVVRERANVDAPARRAAARRRPARGEDRRPGGRRGRPDRRAPARPRRARGRRLRALARPRRPGRDARRRRRPPARALLPPPVHLRPAHRRRSTTSSGCRTRSSGAPSSVAFFARGALHPFTTPLDLLRFPPLSPAARVRMGAAVRRPAAVRRRPGPVRARHRPRVDRALDGPAARGRRCGARCCAASSASAPTTSRWCGCGASCGCGARSAARTPGEERLGYPRDSWEPLFAALARSIEGARRPRADRPAGGVRVAPGDGGRLRVTAGAPGSFRRGHDPRAFDRADGRRGLRPRPRHRAQRRVRAAARPRPGGRGGGGLPRRACARSSTSPRSACCSSSTARSRRFYWTNVADRALPVRRADRAHQLHRARALRRPPLPLRRQLPAARAPAARPRRRRAARPLRAGAARGQPGLRARLGPPRLAASPSRPPSRSSPSATRSASRRCRRRPAACVLANTTQVYPEDRGTNYAVRLGGAAARALLEAPR